MPCNVVQLVKEMGIEHRDLVNDEASHLVPVFSSSRPSYSLQQLLTSSDS